MLGAIIGDIVGSRFEFNNHKSKDFDLFTPECFVTDDSIMTLAVAKAIMETEKVKKLSLSGSGKDHDYYILLSNMTVKYMRAIGRKYPNCGYGGMFGQWMFSDDPQPYDSFGNGAAMRVSPAGFAARNESEASWMAEAITYVTHNHDEGIKGAEAVTVAIYMARRGYLKPEIREAMEGHYSLDFTIDEIRDSYQFNETCQGTVPQAIVAFLESSSFEGAIRTAISIGGDSDTLAAITGSIAEAYYGVSNELAEKALSYLDAELSEIYASWLCFTGAVIQPRFGVLTKYIGKIDAKNSQGTSTGYYPSGAAYIGKVETSAYSYVLSPSIGYDGMIAEFLDEFRQFSDSHTECDLAPIWVGHAESPSVDSLRVLFDDGSISKWLKQLKAMDDENRLKNISEILFEIGGYFQGHTSYHVLFSTNGATLTTTGFMPPTEATQKSLSPEEAIKFLDAFRAIGVEYWNCDYSDPHVCDGTQWGLCVTRNGERAICYDGSNAYPPNFDDLLDLFGIEH